MTEQVERQSLDREQAPGTCLDPGDRLPRREHLTISHERCECRVVTEEVVDDRCQDWNPRDDSGRTRDVAARKSGVCLDRRGTGEIAFGSEVFIEAALNDDK